jgi:uncharacterized protein (DUF1778 family)
LFFTLSGKKPYINQDDESEDTMMPRDTTRSSRFEARLAPDVLAVLKRAAELQGRSLSDFVVAAAQEIAERTIEETSVIRLSLEDQRRFVDLLINPPDPNPALQRAAQAHAELIQSP